MANISGPGCRGKSGPLSPLSRKVKTPKGFQGALSAFSSFILLSQPPVDRKAKRSPSPKNDLYFSSLQRKSSAVSAYAAVDFFFILGGRREYYNFLIKNKSENRTSKAETNPKFKFPIPKRLFRILDFGDLNLFRISNFVLRIYEWLLSIKF